jgi:hypothetical protein
MVGHGLVLERKSVLDRKNETAISQKLLLVSCASTALLLVILLVPCAESESRRARRRRLMREDSRISAGLLLRTTLPRSRSHLAMPSASLPLALLVPIL